MHCRSYFESATDGTVAGAAAAAAAEDEIQEVEEVTMTLLV